MPRLPSIPWYLEQKILLRWMNGESPQEILDWINLSNVDRKEPVKTSRSSVERCLERMSQGESVLSGAAACRRLRCRATSLVEEYDDLNAAYKKQIADAALLDGSVTARVRHIETLRALKAQDVSLARQLKLAGCTGSSAERLEQKAEAMEAADLKKLQSMKDVVRVEHAKQILDVTSQHPDWLVEEVENLVVGDDFADWRAEDILLDREETSPAGPEAGPANGADAEGEGLDPERPASAEGPGSSPATRDAPVEPGSDPGEHFPVSSSESASEQGETNRGTSEAGRGSCGGDRAPAERPPVVAAGQRMAEVAGPENGRDGRATREMHERGKGNSKGSSKGKGR